MQLRGIQAVLFSFFCLLFLVPARGQVSNVNPHVNIIDGEPYYIHTVLEGQEVEAIARAYYTEPQAIAKANPQAVAGLRPGMKLRIPCSFESYDAMSRLKATEEEPAREEPVAESRPPEPTPPPPNEAPDPIQEAVSLIEEESTPESLPEEEKGTAGMESTPDSLSEPVRMLETQESLQELSKSISESLAALDRIKAELEKPTDPTDTNGVNSDPAAPPPAGVLRLNELTLLERVMHEYFEPDTSDTALHLKEFFFVRIDKVGLPLSLEDERTVTNKNTHFLDMDRLHRLRFEVMQAEGLTHGRQAIGLHLDARKHVYDLKIKRKRIRYYRTPLFVEYMKKDHPHFGLIREAADREGKRGRCRVVIYEGMRSVTLHQRFEYNPFAELERVLAEEHFARIESIVFE